MLDAPGGLWLFIFVVSYEIGRAVVTWLWQRRAHNTGTRSDET